MEKLASSFWVLALNSCFQLADSIANKGAVCLRTDTMPSKLLARYARVSSAHPHRGSIPIVLPLQFHAKGAISSRSLTAE